MGIQRLYIRAYCAACDRTRRHRIVGEVDETYIYPGYMECISCFEYSDTDNGLDDAIPLDSLDIIEQARVYVFSERHT